MNPPAVRLLPKARWTRGWWRGFRQASLLATFEVPALPAEASARAEAGLRRLLQSPTAEHPQGCISPLLWHMVQATQQLQREAGLVLDTMVSIEPAAQADRAGARQISTHLPVASLSATHDALVQVVEATNRLLAGADPATLGAPLEALRRRLRANHRSGQNTPYLLQAALDMDLPAERITEQLVRLGHGARQRLFGSTLTDRTSALATVLARDKLATARLLRRIGLPGAQNEPVADADAALQLARRWGYPVVVKPQDLDGGVGVAADLRDDASLRLAFDEARRHSTRVLLERHVEGTGHRITVAHGRVVKLAAKAPWGVVGDGRRSIEALAVADPPRRAPAHAGPFMLDAEALGLLQQQGLHPHSVLEAGRMLPLRRRNNSAAGGRTTPLDVDTMHADNHALALRAAEALGLDTAGIDLIVADITRSWTGQPALICEVNAQPQTDRRTLAAWLAEEIGPGGVRIPVWLVLLPDGRAATDGAVARWAARIGATAWASAAAAWVGETRLVGATGAGGDAWTAAGAVLLSRQVDSALLVLPWTAVLEHGLPVDRLQGCWVGEDEAAIDALMAAVDVPGQRALHVSPRLDHHQAAGMALLREGIGPHLGPV